MSILVSRDGAILRLVMDNPARGNALSPAMMLEMAEALAASVDDSLRLVIIRGAGERVFCSGYDLAELQLAGRPGSAPPEDWAERFPELTALVRAIEDCPVPLIAAINGHAIGGGALLASLCDLRIAARGTKFRIPATRLGVLYPLEGIRRLVALIGAGRAASILLRAETVSDEEGVAWGLYDELVEVDELDSRVDALAVTLCARAPLALRGFRAVLRAMISGSQDSDLAELHHQWASRCLGSSDIAEGITAAIERREPQFRGH